MTTLATDGTTIAADGQVTCGDTIEDTNAKNVFRLKDGRAFGFAGCLASGFQFQWWPDNGMNLDELPTLSEDFSAVVIDGSKTVLVFDHLLRTMKMPAPYTTGSGMQYAITAMDLGATPKEAVKAACKRDVWSSGTIRSVTVKAKDKSDTPKP
jgi:ATP-dependent protease HslVU (ClpYQ) peptidase subunit